MDQKELLNQYYNRRANQILGTLSEDRRNDVLEYMREPDHEIYSFEDFELLCKYGPEEYKAVKKLTNMVVEKSSGMMGKLYGKLEQITNDLIQRELRQKKSS